MKKILSIILMLITINVNAQFKLSEYPDSVIILNDSSFFDVSRFNGGGSFTSSKMRALRLPPFILKGWAFDPIDSAFYPIVSGKNIGRNTNRIDTLFLNSVFDIKNTSDLSFYNGVTRMIIKSAGEIGIGTPNPVSLFNVEGGLSTFEGINAGSSNFVGKFQDNVGTDLLAIRNDGHVGILNTTFTRNLVVESSNTGLFDGIAVKSSSIIHALLVGRNPTGGYLSLRDNTGTSVVDFNSSLSFDFLNTGKKFGVGTDLPDAKLHVKTNLTGVTLCEFEHTDVDSDAGIKLISTDGRQTLIAFNDVTAERARIICETTDNLNFFTSGVTNNPLELTGSGNVLLVQSSGSVGIRTASPSATLHVLGDAIIDSLFSIPTKIDTLGIGVTTFVVRGNKMKMTGDGGANTIATITGGIDGMTLTLTFTDALITLTDDNTSTANTINLSAAFTSTANDIVILEFDGTSWREANRSAN